MTDDLQWKRFEELHDRQLSFFREKKFVDAAEMWKDAAGEFEAAGFSEHAAHASALAGSAYSCAQENAEALAAYKRATELEPTDAIHRLAAGRFLLEFNNDPGQALGEIEAAIDLAARNPNTLYSLSEALGLLGVAWLRLGRLQEADELFQSTCRTAAAGPLKPALDLRLASEYAKQGRFTKEGAQFAVDAAEWAKATNNDDLMARVKGLERHNETSA